MLEELHLITDALAGRLRRSVAVDDPQLRLLVHTPHGARPVERYRMLTHRAATEEAREWVLKSGIATADTPVRIPANPDLEVTARVCVPVRCHGDLLAYLWLLNADQPVSDTDVDLAALSADTIGRLLHHERLLSDQRRERDRQQLRDLLSNDASVREPAAHQLIADGRLPEPARAAVLRLQVQPDDRPDTRTAIDTALRTTASRLAPLHATAAPLGTAAGVLLIADHHPPPAARLQTIAESLREQITATTPGDITVRIGIGPVVDTINHAHLSHTRAQHALTIATRIPGYTTITPWDTLGIYQLLVQLPPDQFRDTTIPPGLLHLLQTDDTGTLVDTLETYLDEATRPSATVERLQIHRTSLYHRLQRIEQATAMDLGNGHDRLTLHLGLKMARLIGLLQNHGPGSSRASPTPRTIL